MIIGHKMASDTNSSDGFNVSSALDYCRMYRAEYNAEMRDAFIPVMVITGIESVIGIIGNSLVFYVFSRRYKKCNFKLFVLFLCGTDLAGCITSLPLDIAMRYNYFDVPGRIFCKINFYFSGFILLAETFLLLVICIDRYRKICHPLSWQISNRSASRLTMLALLIACIVAGLTSWIVTGSNTKEVTYQNMTIMVQQCGSAQKYKDTPVPVIIVIVKFTIIVGISLVMMVLYIRVARQLYNAKASFDSNPNPKTDKSQFTFFKANIAPARRKSIIAFSLTVVFIVTVTLHSVFLYLLATHNLEDLSKGEWVVYTFFSTAFNLNYCLNPIIYGCLDHQFSKFLPNLTNRYYYSRDVYSTDDGCKVGSSTNQTGIETHSD